MGSLMRYQGVHGAVFYLASESSDFVTGQDLIIDGGHTVNTWLRPLKRKQPPLATVEDEESEMNMALENIRATSLDKS